MAFLSSNAPLPQNSLQPPPAWKVAASNARLYANAQASMTGRERVYSDLPGIESFWGEGAGLARDAAYIIPASEMARRSVLNGLTPLGTASSVASDTGAMSPVIGQPIAANPPQVLSLNAPAAQAVGASPVVFPTSPTMPIGAPTPGPYGYMKPGGSQMQHARRAPHVQPGQSSIPCASRGVSGYAPPWSDAFAVVTGQCGARPSSMNWWVLGILGAGLVGLAHAGKRGRF